MLDRRTAIASFYGALEVMRSELHTRVEAQTMMGFLVIARGQTTVGEVGKALELTDGGASRLVSLLTDEKNKRTDKPGYGLVVRTEDSEHRSYKNVCLSPKGEDLLRRIMDALEAPQALADARQQAASKSCAH